ncbi:MAG: YheU family protein [Planctomycetia bacterium]|nr:YheU family protein [Planctomycetia bacterium]
MRVPHKQLSPSALRAVVEEFVTRDGTDDSAVERRVEEVLHQLDFGKVVVHFDMRTKTCNILPVEDAENAGGEDQGI